MVDWDKYLIAANQILGRSLTEKLDSHRVPVKTTGGFITTLSAMQGIPENQNQVLSNPGSKLQHYFYGFLVIGSQELMLEIASETPLSLVYAETIKSSILLSLVSGNMSQWISAINNSSVAIASNDLRQFANKAQIYFESEGLALLWKNFEKKSFSSDSFILESK